MQFSKIAVLAFVSGVIASPLARRNGGGGGGECETDPKVCDSGSQYCNTLGAGLWSKAGASCSSGDVYCCNTKALVSAVECTNVLSGNTVVVPIDVLVKLLTIV